MYQPLQTRTTHSSTDSEELKPHIKQILGRFDDDKPLSLQDEKKIAITKEWVKEWVIKLRLCPWAASVFNDSSMRIFVDNTDYSTEEGKETLLYSVLAECHYLATSVEEKDLLKTTLIIIPSLKSFDDYLDFHSAVEDLIFDELDEEEDESEEGTKEGDEGNEKPMSAAKYLDKVQIATFHPKYTFADAESSLDVENYTNRSPFPMLHLLSVPDVTRAIENYAGEISDVWERNKMVMKETGKRRVLSEQKRIIQSALDKIAGKQKEEEYNQEEERKNMAILLPRKKSLSALLKRKNPKNTDDEKN